MVTKIWVFEHRAVYLVGIFIAWANMPMDLGSWILLLKRVIHKARPIKHCCSKLESH